MNLLQKATDDTKKLIEMGSPVFSVNDAGYILKDGEKYLISTDGNGQGKPGLIIQDPLPNGEYFLINPYGEGGGVHSTPLNFFYRIMLAGFVQSLVCATTNVLVMLVSASQKKITSVPPEVLKVGAMNKVGDDALTDVIDARMVKEFEKIDALAAGRIHLIYPPKKMRVSLHLENMTHDVLKTDLGKGVRERTIHVYLAILHGILGVSDEAGLEKFTTVYDPEIKAPPKLWCFLNSLLKCYLAISGVLDDVGLFPKKLDLAELAAIIERVPEVFKQSRHVIQVEYGQKEVPASQSMRRPSDVSRTSPQQQSSSFRDAIFGTPRPSPLRREEVMSSNAPGIARRFSDAPLSGGRSFSSPSIGDRSFFDAPRGRTFTDNSTYDRRFEQSLTTRRFT